MSNWNFRTVAWLTLVLMAGGVQEVAAQKADTFPSKAIRIVVPFPPGGGSDILGRLVSPHMTESLGQPVLIENRPGAGTMIGTEAVLKAPADGHTLLVAVTAFVINPTLYRKVNYDPLRDFTPVSLGINFPYMLVVHPSLPVKSVKELIALAKRNPGKITYASSGTGLSNHLAGEMFKDAAGIDIIHVPYKGGGPALNAMLGGEVSMAFGTVLQTLPQVRAQKLRALAVSSAKRVSFAADLPTIAEAGLPGFEGAGWYSFAVAAGTPPAVIARLNQEIVRILGLPNVRESLIAMGTEPTPSTVEKAREYYASELTRWAKVVIRAGLKGTE
jgi:tripartite-type tricarboxylate transporter receptor subunit TctC